MRCAGSGFQATVQATVCSNPRQQQNKWTLRAGWWLIAVSSAAPGAGSRVIGLSVSNSGIRAIGLWVSLV